MDLFQAFQNINGNKIISIDTITPVLLKGGKKNPMQGRIQKRVIGANVQVFARSNFQNMVNRRLEKEEKEPDFLSQPRTWGNRIPNMPIVEHNGKFYLEAIFIKAPSKVEYLLDGNPIEKQDIIGLDTDKTESKQGGLSEENKVIIRTYNSENIVAIRGV